MWLGLLLIIIVVAALGASIVSGGIFTIIVLPVAVAIALIALFVSAWGRASGRSAPSDKPDPGPPSLPHSAHRNSAPAPSTPDQLVDAKRAQQ